MAVVDLVVPAIVTEEQSGAVVAELGLVGLVVRVAELKKMTVCRKWNVLRWLICQFYLLPGEPASLDGVCPQHLEVFAQ